MANKIKYDVSNLRQQSREISKVAQDLENAVNQLGNDVDRLKDEWVSDAATAFFDKLGNNWKPPIESYVQMLRELASALSEAAADYEPLEESYNKITIY